MVEDYLKTRQISLALVVKQGLSLACLPMAFGVYALYVRYGLQTLWPWQALQVNWGVNPGLPWQGLWGNITSLTTRSHLFQFSVPGRVADTALAILAIVILVLIAKKIPRAELAYAAALLYMFLTKVTVDVITVSVARYLVSVYILFIGLALLVKNKYLKMGLFFLFAVSQALLIAYFEMWGWVA